MPIFKPRQHSQYLYLWSSLRWQTQLTTVLASKKHAKAMGFLAIQLAGEQGGKKPTQPTDRFQTNISGLSHPDLNWSSV